MNETEREAPVRYCVRGWADFWSPFNAIYDPLILSLCIVGVITNTFNILCFTRIKTPTNLILLSLAITDFLALFREGVEQLTKNQSQTSEISLGIAVYNLIHRILYFCFHTWSVYLTLTLSIWRFIGILNPLQSKFRCTFRAAKCAIILSFTISSLLIPPLFVQISVKEVNLTRAGTVSGTGNGSGVEMGENSVRHTYVTAYSDLDLALWVHSIVVKTIPCIIMTFFSCALVYSLVKAGRARKKLGRFGGGDSEVTESTASFEISKSASTSSTISCASSSSSSSVQPVIKSSQNSKSDSNSNVKKPEFHRTTQMLIVLLFIFLLTEFPCGILDSIRAVIQTPEYYDQCYEPILNFFRFNQYLNSLTTFFVYWFMSHGFRSVFKNIITDFNQWVKNLWRKVGGFFCGGSSILGEGKK